MQAIETKEIPEEMQRSKQWILTVIKPNKQGGLDKTPYNSIKWSQPENLKDYETIINEKASIRDNYNLIPAFVLNNSNIWCVDLDNHAPDEETGQAINTFNNSVLEIAKHHNLYITKSVSGKGYHIYGKFDNPTQKEKYKTHKGKFEFYSDKKYICEDPDGEVIQYSETLDKSSEFLQALTELVGNSILKDAEAPTPETEETQPKPTTKAKTNPPASDDKYIVVSSSDASPEQLKQVIINHTDKGQQDKAKSIFNGNYAHGTESEQLQTLYNFTYYWTSDFNKFMGVLTLAPSLYNYYIDKYKNYDRVVKELERKCNKSNLSTHQADFKFDRITGDFIGFYNQPTINYNVIFPNETEETQPALNENWIKNLEFNQNGSVKKTIDNILMILENDINFKDYVYLNEFSYQIVKVKDGVTTLWSDADDAKLRYYLETKYKITKAKEIIQDAFLIYLDRHKKHPIKEYFQSLDQWDGIPRIQTIFTDYLGAEDTELNREIAKIFFTGAVTRIYKPGCKFDYMTVLIGQQGLRKSMFFNILGGDYFTDSLYSIENNKGIEAITGFWIIEFAELSALTKSDLEATKHFITSQADTYRVPYNRHTETRPRQCVFCGTTNNLNFLKDTTGNRRFFCVEVNKHLTDDKQKELQASVKQIWAEALHLFHNGQKLYLSPELEQQSIEKQEEHTFESLYKSIIENYLNMLIPLNWYDMTIEEHINYVNHYEDELKKINENKKINPNYIKENYGTLNVICPLILYKEAIQGDITKIPRNISLEITNILNSQKNWKPYKKVTFKNYGQQRAYKRI